MTQEIRGHENLVWHMGHWVPCGSDNLFLNTCCKKGPSVRSPETNCADTHFQPKQKVVQVYIPKITFDLEYRFESLTSQWGTWWLDEKMGMMEHVCDMTRG